MGPIHPQSLSIEPGVVEHQIALYLAYALAGQLRGQRLVVGKLNARVAQATQVQVAGQAVALAYAVAQQLGGEAVLRPQHIHGRRRGQQLEVGRGHQPGAWVVLIQRGARAGVTYHQRDRSTLQRRIAQQFIQGCRS